MKKQFKIKKKLKNEKNNKLKFAIQLGPRPFRRPIPPTHRHSWMKLARAMEQGVVPWRSMQVKPGSPKRLSEGFTVPVLKPFVRASAKA